MKPTIAPPSLPCREYVGEPQGWCSNPAEGGQFCTWHATARRHYDEQTRRRTGAIHA